jgi:hypothetical protein
VRRALNGQERRFPARAEEANQLATLAAVKARNPAVPGVFYLNTILDFNFLGLHQKYADADALVHNTDGSLCELVNDNGMRNITVFDYGTAAGRALWLGEVKRLVATGVVDGFYGDTMQACKVYRVGPEVARWPRISTANPYY